MSGALNHSPADALRKALVALGLAAEPPATTWPAYATVEPDLPDNAITVFDTAGRDRGRDMVANNRVIHHGIQVRVRSATHVVGYAKANAIAVALDSLYQRAVTIDLSTYLIHDVSRTGDVLALGKNLADRRSVFTINALLTVKKIAG